MNRGDRVRKCLHVMKRLQYICIVAFACPGRSEDVGRARSSSAVGSPFKDEENAGGEDAKCDQGAKLAVSPVAGQRQWVSLE